MHLIRKREIWFIAMVIKEAKTGQIYNINPPAKEMSNVKLICPVCSKSHAPGKQEKPEPEPEEYLTPKEFADTLHISLVSLWSWDKKGLTKPLRIGNKKLYRMSDLEKILKEG